MKDFLSPKFPLWFKIWFGAIAAFVVCWFLAAGYLLSQVVAAGPEGIGREIGALLKGIDQGRQ